MHFFVMLLSFFIASKLSLKGFEKFSLCLEIVSLESLISITSWERQFSFESGSSRTWWLLLVQAGHFVCKKGSLISYENDDLNQALIWIWMQSFNLYSYRKFRFLVSYVQNWPFFAERGLTFCFWLNYENTKIIRKLEEKVRLFWGGFLAIMAASHFFFNILLFFFLNFGEKFWFVFGKICAHSMKVTGKKTKFNQIHIFPGCWGSRQMGRHNCFEGLVWWDLLACGFLFKDFSDCKNIDRYSFFLFVCFS